MQWTSASGLPAGNLELPSTSLDGAVITHLATLAAIQTYTPAAGVLVDSAVVTNNSANTPIRIGVTAATTLGSKVFLVYPKQSVSVWFAANDPITAITSVPVTLPAVQWAVNVSTLVANATPWEVVSVSIVLVDK